MFANVICSALDPGHNDAEALLALCSETESVSVTATVCMYDLKSWWQLIVL